MRAQYIDEPVTIVSDLPRVVLCSGKNFFETKKMSIKQLLLFIDRDIRLYLSQFPSFAIKDLDCRLDRHIPDHYLIGFSAPEAASTILTAGIESILWSYNHQIFKQEGGRLVPESPRFTYQIGIQSPGNIIPFAGGLKHA